MPRFVVLLHETPPGYPRGRHYDLMLEQDGALWTWAINALPCAGGEAIPAERLPDHRLAYLECEGDVAGNRGSVSRIDRGACELVSAAADEIRLRVAGAILTGTLTLSPPLAGSGNWTLRLLSSQP